MDKLSIKIRLKSFNSIDEVVNDTFFVARVKYHLSEVLKQRHARPAAPIGYHYKKDGLDMLVNESNANYVYFINNFPDIYAKVSNISSARRDVISFVCNNAVAETLDHYDITVIAGNKFHVKESRAKLKVIDIKQEDSTITIEMLKKRETWPIQKFVNSVSDGTLTLIKEIVS